MNTPHQHTHALPTLVVVVNNLADWQRVCDDQWYRIPVQHAPPTVAASYLAFYQTGCFGQEAHTISWYAPVRRYLQVTRHGLLPEDPKHPRANELYYRIDLGALVALPRPIPACKLRRITFIATTLGRLLQANEINDLWLHNAAEDVLWHWFPDAGIKAERRLTIEDGWGE